MLRFSILSVIVVGCGGTVSESPVTADSATTETSTIDSDVDTAVIDTGDIPTMPDMGPPPGPGASPPARPTVMVAGGATKWFAIKKLQLGLTRRSDGVPDFNAWKQYGYDLDKRTTTADDSKLSTNSCKRVEGSPTKVLLDGDLGRDNNFGQHFMSVVKSLKADAEDAVNSLITDGRATLILRLDNVGPTDNASVPGALFLGGGLGSPPKFDGTDKWPIDSSSVDATKEARAKFPKGYMAGGVWVSGEVGTTSATIPLPSFGTTWMVPMESVVISFDVASGANGTIAGASQTTKFVDAITPMMKQWGICPGNATFDQIAATIQQSADLVSGAPLLQDTSRACNSMSIGLGFTAAPTSPSGTIVSAPSLPDECGP
jgi:hypothetical protein